MKRIGAAGPVQIKLEFEYLDKDLQTGAQDFYGIAMTEMRFKKTSEFVTGIHAGTLNAVDKFSMGVSGSINELEIKFDDKDPNGTGAPVYRYDFATTQRVRFNQTVESVGSFTGGVSDLRLKENVEPISNPLEKVNQLQGVTFDWNDKAKEVAKAREMDTETGLIAQDVEKVVPDAVIPAPFNYNYKTINYDKIVPLLVESVKTLSDKVNKLEAIISGSNTT